MEIYAKNESTNHVIEDQKMYLTLKLRSMMVEGKDTLNIENKIEIIRHVEDLRDNCLSPLFSFSYIQVTKGWLG